MQSRETIRAATTSLPDWPGHRLALLNEHTEILNAIEAGDSNAAATLLEQHIRRAYDTLGIGLTEDA